MNKFINLGEQERQTMPDEVRQAAVPMYAGRLSMLMLDAADVNEGREARMVPDNNKALRVASALGRVANVNTALARFMLRGNGELLNRGYFNFAFISGEDGQTVRKLNRLWAGVPRPQLEHQLRRRQEDYGIMKDYFGELVLDTEYSIQELLYAHKPYSTICIEQARLSEVVDIYSQTGRLLVSDDNNSGLRSDVEAFVTATRRGVVDGLWPDIIGPDNLAATPIGNEWRLRLLDPEPYEPGWLNVSWSDDMPDNTSRLELRLAELAAMVGPIPRASAAELV